MDKVKHFQGQTRVAFEKKNTGLFSKGFFETLDMKKVESPPSSEPAKDNEELVAAKRNLEQKFVHLQRAKEREMQKLRDEALEERQKLERLKLERSRESRVSDAKEMAGEEQGRGSKEHFPFEVCFQVPEEGLRFLKRSSQGWFQLEGYKNPIQELVYHHPKTRPIVGFSKQEDRSRSNGGNGLIQHQFSFDAERISSGDYSMLYEDRGGEKILVQIEVTATESRILSEEFEGWELFFCYSEQRWFAQMVQDGRKMRKYFDQNDWKCFPNSLPFPPQLGMEA